MAGSGMVQDKVVVVTGAGRGIGRGFDDRFNDFCAADFRCWDLWDEL